MVGDNWTLARADGRQTFRLLISYMFRSVLYPIMKKNSDEGGKPTA